MRRFLLASATLLGMATYSYAAPVPSTAVPTPIFATSDFQQGVTDSVSGVRLSPFFGTSADGRAYDVVYGNGGPGTVNPLGLAAEFSPTEFNGSSGAGGVFRFLIGSPDTYNVLSFNLVGGSTAVFQGSQIANPVNGSGFQVVTLRNIGAYTSVDFGSISSNAFEFTSVVPLPASAPMFGAALLAFGAFGYGMKRSKAAAAA